MLEDGKTREELTEGIYIPKDPKQALGRLEHAFKAVHRAEAAEKKIKKAIRDGALPKKKVYLLLDDAKAKNIISADEHRMILESDAIRFDAILVDDFSEDQYHGRAPYP